MATDRVAKCWHNNNTTRKAKKSRFCRLLWHLVRKQSTAILRTWHEVMCWWVAWHSGVTSVFGRRSFPVLCLTCIWRVTSYMGTSSAAACRSAN